MITVTDTELHGKFFDYLDKATNGATICIERDGVEIGRLVPPSTYDWRNKMSVRVQFLVEPDELIKPTEGIWNDYI